MWCLTFPTVRPHCFSLRVNRWEGLAHMEYGFIHICICVISRIEFHIFVIWIWKLKSVNFVIVIFLKLLSFSFPFVLFIGLAVVADQIIITFLQVIVTIHYFWLMVRVRGVIFLITFLQTILNNLYTCSASTYASVGLSVKQHAPMLWSGPMLISAPLSCFSSLLHFIGLIVAGKCVAGF